LAAPKPTFPLQFLNYLFHYSFWVYGTLLFVFLAALLTGGEKMKINQSLKKRILLVLWFFLPMIAGYIYSIRVEPILQFSLLLFTTPYLFVLFFSFLKEISFRNLTFAVAVLLLANIISLVFYRKHYGIFYKQPSEEIVKQAVELEKAHPGDVFFITNTIPYYNEYYFKKYKKVIPYYTIRNKELGPHDFETMISGIKEQVVVTENVSENTFPLVQKYFPFWSDEEKGFTFEDYIFSKNPPKDGNLLEKKLVAFTNFDTVIGNWSDRNEHWIEDSVTGETKFEVRPDMEWTVTAQIPLTDFRSAPYLIFDIDVELEMLNPWDNALLVATLVNNDETIGYRAAALQDYLYADTLNRKLSLSFDLLTFFENNDDLKNGILKTYIWNREFRHFYIKSYSISVREGNPFRFALYDGFHE
jgi:hypothetical protein